MSKSKHTPGPSRECPHREGQWCYECVAKLHEERAELLDALNLTAEDHAEYGRATWATQAQIQSLIAKVEAAYDE